MSTNSKTTRREARDSIQDIYALDEDLGQELTHLTDRNRKRDHKRELKQTKKLARTWYND